MASPLCGQIQSGNRLQPRARSLHMFPSICEAAGRVELGRKEKLIANFLGPRRRRLCELLGSPVDFRTVELSLFCQQAESSQVFQAAAGVM